MPTYPNTPEDPIAYDIEARRVRRYYNGTEYWIKARTGQTWISAWQGLNWYQFPQDYTNPPRPDAAAYSIYDRTSRHASGHFWPSFANQAYKPQAELECCKGHWVPIYPDRYSWCNNCQAVFSTTPSGISVQYPPNTVIEGEYPWNGATHPIGSYQEVEDAEDETYDNHLYDSNSDFGPLN